MALAISEHEEFVQFLLQRARDERETATRRVPGTRAARSYNVGALWPDALSPSVRAALRRGVMPPAGRGGARARAGRRGARARAGRRGARARAGRRGAGARARGAGRLASAMGSPIASSVLRRSSREMVPEPLTSARAKKASAVAAWRFIAWLMIWRARPCRRPLVRGVVCAPPPTDVICLRHACDARDARITDARLARRRAAREGPNRPGLPAQ